MEVWVGQSFFFLLLSRVKVFCCCCFLLIKQVKWFFFIENFHASLPLDIKWCAPNQTQVLMAIQIMKTNHDLVDLDR